MSFFRRNLNQLKKYPTAIVGLLMIMALVVIAIYTLLTIPYSEAVRLWRGGEGVWADNPRTAWPVWYNLFSGKRLTETIVLNSAEGDVEKIREAISEDVTEVNMIYTFDFPYESFPKELILFFETEYEEKQPFLTLTWLTPDGREIRLGDVATSRSGSFRFSQEERLVRRLGGVNPEIGLFVDPETVDSEEPVPIQGEYTLVIEGLVFEDDSDVDTKLVMFGEVHGLAGTDHRRRDLMVALLWGTPVALAFGLLAALITTFSSMFIAAVGVWFGGVFDAIIQRVTEVNNIIPLLPILVMIGTFYSRSLWVILGAVIVLSIFGLSIKNYRAVFLQVRELPYIEAARAYGAGNTRLIFRYMVPRILPLAIPSLVIQVPSFVFLEAALAVLGLGDPVLPTWGKLISDARAEGALFNGYYYWVLEPAVLLMIVGFGFALLGFALDRVFNPRLREL